MPASVTTRSQAAAPRVVRIITRLECGGPPIHCVLLTREMQRRGYSTLLVTGACDGPEHEMAYLLQPNDPVVRVMEMSASISPWKDVLAFGRIFRLLRRLRPDVVHTHTAKAGLLGRVAAKLAGVPVIVHTFHGNVLSEYFSRPVSWTIRNVERALARITDAVCVLSSQQASQLSDQFGIAPRQKLFVIALGMDLSAFERLPPPTPSTPATVGWIGRFVPVKNIPLLVDIMGRVFEKDVPVRFLIAGDGPESGIVKQAVARWGRERIQWVGWQRDILGVLAQCDLLIQTSKNEGTPVALIQGMAAGRPFVSTPAGGVVDMVDGPPLRSDGTGTWHSNGVLVTASPAAFASAIGALARDPRLLRSMGERARTFACRNYRLSTLTEQVDSLYSHLLRMKGRSDAARAVRAAA